MPSLTEQYHPRTWDDLVGQPDALRKLDNIRNSRGTLAGGNYWISGPSGTGKSSIADLIAAEVAHPCCIHEIGGRKLGVTEVDELRREMRTRGFDPGGRVVVINEAHALRKPVIEELLVATDPRKLPEYASFVFTTTNKGQAAFEDYDDAGPLLSRCTRLELTADSEEFAIRLMTVAQAENMDGQPLSAYVDLLRECRGNLREALNRIETGDMLVAAPKKSRILVGRRN